MTVFPLSFSFILFSFPWSAPKFLIYYILYVIEPTRKEKKNKEKRICGPNTGRNEVHSLWLRPVWPQIIRDSQEVLVEA